MPLIVLLHKQSLEATLLLPMSPHVVIPAVSIPSHPKSTILPPGFLHNDASTTSIALSVALLSASSVQLALQPIQPVEAERPVLKAIGLFTAALSAHQTNKCGNTPKGGTEECIKRTLTTLHAHRSEALYCVVANEAVEGDSRKALECKWIMGCKQTLLLAMSNLGLGWDLPSNPTNTITITTARTTTLTTTATPSFSSTPRD